VTDGEVERIVAVLTDSLEAVCREDGVDQGAARHQATMWGAVSGEGAP
jgi:hypothetical protein